MNAAPESDPPSGSPNSASAARRGRRRRWTCCARCAATSARRAITSRELHRAARGGSPCERAALGPDGSAGAAPLRIAEASASPRQGGAAPARARCSRSAATRGARCRSTRTSICCCCHEAAVTPYVTRLVRADPALALGRGRSRWAAPRARSPRRSSSRATTTPCSPASSTRASSPESRSSITSSPTRSARELLADVEHFLERQIDGARSGTTAYGESLYLLQPNLKEGAGGLRDYHAAIWAMRAVLPSRARPRRSAPLRPAHRVRRWRTTAPRSTSSGGCATSSTCSPKRRQDQMSFELQEQIAAALGYPRRRPEAPLPVERFMGDYYRHARAIRNYSELVIEQCRARVRGELRSGAARARRRRRLPRRGRSARDPARGAPARATAAPAHGVRGRAGARRAALAQGAAPGAREPAPGRRRVSPRPGDHGRLPPHPRRREARDAHADDDERDRPARALPARVGAHRLPLAARDLSHLHRRRALDLPGRGAAPPVAGQVRARAAGADGADARRAKTARCSSSAACSTTSARASAAATTRPRAPSARASASTGSGSTPSASNASCSWCSTISRCRTSAQRRDLSDPEADPRVRPLMGDRTNLRDLYLLTFADIRASSKAGWNEWRGAAARALRAHLGVARDGRARRSAWRSRRSSRASRRAGRRRATSCARSASPRPRSTPTSTRCRAATSSRTAPRQIARHAPPCWRSPRRRASSTAVREMRGGFSELIVVHARRARALLRASRGRSPPRASTSSRRTSTPRARGWRSRSTASATPPGGEEDRERTWVGLRGESAQGARGRGARRGSAGAAPAPDRRDRDAVANAAAA